MAFVALANYTQTNYELAYAVKFMRILNLVLTALFGIYGFIVGVGVFVLSLINNKMFLTKSKISLINLYILMTSSFS